MRGEYEVAICLTEEVYSHKSSVRETNQSYKMKHIKSDEKKKKKSEQLSISKTKY
jgi:hypothetical protein